MKNVNALLKKEQQAKDILANIGREKEELAIKKLAEVKEIWKSITDKDVPVGIIFRLLP